MAARSQILQFLSDREPHPVADIAYALAASEQVVRAEIAALVRLGLAIEQLRGGVYCLQTAVQPLDARRIRDDLGPKHAALADHLRVCDEVDSTNSYLLREVSHGRASCGAICLAEAQAAGRGRWGRSWIATPYASIMLSIAWCMQRAHALMDGLSLAIGVAVVRALNDCGIHGIGLKWPNDVIWNERKLAGVLVEASRRRQHRAVVVIGVGINVDIAPHEAQHIEQPWVDLKTIGSRVLDRNRLVALLIEHVVDALAVFGRSGFAPFHEHWERMHVHQGRHVRLLIDGQACSGRIAGVNTDGALRLVDDHGTTRLFHGGEISLRPAP